jgi:hypothetical protein
MADFLFLDFGCIQIDDTAVAPILPAQIAQQAVVNPQRARNFSAAATACLKQPNGLNLELRRVTSAGLSH